MPKRPQLAPLNTKEQHHHFQFPPDVQDSYSYLKWQAQSPYRGKLFFVFTIKFLQSLPKTYDHTWGLELRSDPSLFLLQWFGAMLAVPIDGQSYAPFSLAHEQVPIKLKFVNRKRKSIVFWQRTMASDLGVPAFILTASHLLQTAPVPLGGCGQKKPAEPCNPQKAERFA